MASFMITPSSTILNNSIASYFIAYITKQHYTDTKRGYKLFERNKEYIKRSSDGKKLVFPIGFNSSLPKRLQQAKPKV